VKHFRTALTYKEDNAYALGYLGLVYERQGRDDLASYYYLKSLDIDPRDAETNYFLAANLARRDKCRLAVPLLETAVDTFPGYVEAWRLLAECHVERGNFAAAAEAYRRLLALVPRDARALARYASVLMETGKFEEGVATARRALAFEPKVPGAHLLLGKYYLLRGEAAAAARELEAERRISPWSLQVLSDLTGCYLTLGDRAAADAAYRDYLALGGTPIGELEPQK
jgi:Flp pilus assembly protein TadD